MIVNPEIESFLKQQKKVTLGFSTGKDSLACAVILRNLGVEYIPFYFYVCPDLEFTEKSVTMYEKLLGISVVRMPHPMLYDFFRHQDFQPPQMIEWLHALHLPKITFEDLIACHLSSVGDNGKYYDVVGMRSAESFNRRKFFEKGKKIDPETRKVYPIFDWKKGDVLQFLAANKIPLSDDYPIWNRSYDGMKYQFLFGVKKYYPNDWKKLLEYFPLLELELFRYEQNRKYF